MADLKNELVWSHSRARLFGDCLRAYWFCYYGSWGGWDSRADPEIRQTYLEKKLTRRPMWIGTVVHGVAEEALKRARNRQPWPVEDAVRAAIRGARADIAGSESGDWTSRPARRVGFAEHYYGEAVTPEQWEESLVEIERQIRVLYEHRIFQRLHAVPDRILELEELQRFPVGGQDVYVALDVLVSDGHGGVVIIDWKTGEAHDDDTIAAQLGVYGLYVTRVRGVAEDRVKAMHVNLRHDQETLHRVGPDEIAAAEEEIATTSSAMKARLDDVAGNVARREDHPPLPEGSGRCRTCGFRRVCGREHPA